MKNLKALVLGSLLSIMALPAFATSDGHTHTYIVARDVQSGEFFIERAPMIGCFGPVRGPQLAQFTAEYKVTSNIGCGGQSVQENINYLTCAKVVSETFSDDFMSYSEIKLDISRCADKNDPKLISMIRKAAKMNFPLKSGEVKLELVK